MKDLIFYTTVSDDYYELVGTPKLINSFRKFHPDIPFKIFGQTEINTVWAENPWITWDTAKATFGKMLASDYRLVVNIDADSMITGELTEIISGDYDLGSVLNNNDHDPKASFGHITSDKYVNAGLIASTNKEFWDIYESTCRSYGETTGFKEQDVFNTLFWSGGYKIRVFDWYSSLCYYGVASRGQWDKMTLEGDKIMLNNRQVKIIHEAGGHKLPKMELRDDQFSPEVVKRLRELAS
jgi:hypothetical protein